VKYSCVWHIMARHVVLERVPGREARAMPFLALRSGTSGVVANVNDAIGVAQLMFDWARLGKDAGLLCTFEERVAASSWLTSAPPPLPAWTVGTCVATDNAGVIDIDVETIPVPVFALLCEAGGQLAVSTQSSPVAQLVNTVKALNGEVAVVRSLLSVRDAESWLLAPDLPRWMLGLLTSSSGATASSGGTALASTGVDGVIELSDDEAGVEDKDAAARDAFRQAAQALPRRRATKRNIMSMSSLQDSMLLPLAFQRHPVTGKLLRDPGPEPTIGTRTAVCGPNAASTIGGSCSSYDTGASLLPPPSPVPSLSSRTPRRSLVASSLGAGLSASTAGRSATAAGRLASAAGLTASAAGQSASASPRPAPQTCTPVPASVTASDVGPSKRLRLLGPLPFDMGRLAKSILRRKAGLFVTGGGGVGKTWLLRQCADEYCLAQSGSRGGLQIVAPTGVAAAVAGGVTLHAYLRLPAACFDQSLTEEEDAARLYKLMDASTKKRLAATSLLLVDEVSMVSSRMFSLLVHSMDMAHTTFKKDAPWQMIAFGDFFQLPPVRGDEDLYDTSGMYAFKSEHWVRLFKNEKLELRYVWRQEDKMFINMLSRLRVGDLSEDLCNFLETRSKAYHSRLAAGGLTDLDVTHIFPRRHRVNAHNRECLDAMELLNGCVRKVFDAADYPISAYMTEEQVTTQLDAALMAPKKLELCVGARVAACAAVVGDDMEVPNGTVGTVVRFKAIGAHGSGGTVSFLPVVRFSTVRGPVTMVVNRVDMKLQSVARDGAYASRYQIPLVLAWAVTVHRCQGLSMDAAVMDLAACFVDGMVYVALSRVRSMEGVHILSFSRGTVRADGRVASFYDGQRDLDDVFLDCVDAHRR